MANQNQGREWIPNIFFFLSLKRDYLKNKAFISKTYKELGFFNLYPLIH